jgi:hypothetical protein
MRAMKPSRKTISKIRSALATTLVFWCAGAGCMMMSYAHGVAMSTAEANSFECDASGQASGSVDEHDCCTARQRSERRVPSSNHLESSSGFATNLEGFAELPTSSDAMSCCPLTSGTFVVSGRQSLSNENVLAPQGTVAGLVDVITAARFPAVPQRLPNQNQTYLRGCVFLI